MRRTTAILLLLAACETAPKRNEPLLAKAEDFFLRERYAEAAGHYELYISENPADARRSELWVRAGKCHLAAGAPDRAIGAFDRALIAQPAAAVRVDAVFRKGIAQRMTGDLHGALAAFRSTAAASAGDRDGAGVTADDLAYETALAKFQSGDWPGGQAELAKISPHGPYGAKARARQGLSGYVVQIGAFSDEAQARSAAARVSEATVRKAPGQPPLHIVSVGPFARPDDAHREADRLKAAGFRDAFVLP
jgi:tetratricopeptide (TPR) repeat protein